MKEQGKPIVRQPPLPAGIPIIRYFACRGMAVLFFFITFACQAAGRTATPRQGQEPSGLPGGRCRTQQAQGNGSGIIVNGECRILIQKLMKLSELKTGETGVIVKVSGHGGFRKRIIEMDSSRARPSRYCSTPPYATP